MTSATTNANSRSQASGPQLPDSEAAAATEGVAADCAGAVAGVVRVGSAGATSVVVVVVSAGSVVRVSRVRVAGADDEPVREGEIGRVQIRGQTVTRGYFEDRARTAEAFTALSPNVQHWVQTVTILAGGGGFIVTSLVWATALAEMIDGRLRRAAGVLILGGVFALFGVIHSPLPSSPILPPNQAIARLKGEGRFEAAANQTPYHWAAAYALMAGGLIVLGQTGRGPGEKVAESKE